MNEPLDQASGIHRFLTSASSYPERVSTVETKETHISWIYLTDRHVYKRKKPVEFEFLDFSTLEKRKFCCEQEYILNRRFSPKIYLGVVPVFKSDEGFSLQCGTNIVEWLVKMRRLNEADTLENLLAARALTAIQQMELANHLACLYCAQPPVILSGDAFMHDLKSHVEANRLDLLSLIEGRDDLINFASNAQLRCLALEKDYFLQRITEGNIVDGHGDVRPEHIYLGGQTPTIIDCIEFNPSYRTNDIVDELSFLGMECDRLGSPSVGNAVLAAYLHDSETSVRSFLPTFYKCYRACVRAKVAALRTRQLAKELSIHDENNASARTYLQLAKGYSLDLGAKLVIVVGGMSGTGKSTLARALKEKLHGELLQTDVLRRDVITSAASRPEKYSSDNRKKVYQEMINRLEGALKRSPTVILDGTFSTQAMRQDVFEEANRLDANVLQVQCECPLEMARKRIAQRNKMGTDASEATPRLPSKQALSYETYLPTHTSIVADTQQALSKQMNTVMISVRQLVFSSRLWTPQDDPAKAMRSVLQ